jgi:hypothetical protein
VTNRVRNGLAYLMGALVFLGAAVFFIRQENSSRFEKGQAFEKEGRLSDAIEQYEWTVVAYSPGDGRVGEALERLRSIASDAEVRGATSVSVEAWQAIASSLILVDHAAQPYPELLREARKNLARLGRSSVATGEKEEANTP